MEYIHESFVFVIHMGIESVLHCDIRLYSLLQATTKYLKTATQSYYESNLQMKKLRLSDLK